MGPQSGAKEDPDRGNETSEQESGEKRQGSVAMSLFGSERPTPNVQGPMPNSELSIGR
jgi:hypothetical protein